MSRISSAVLLGLILRSHSHGAPGQDYFLAEGDS